MNRVRYEASSWPGPVETRVVVGLFDFPRETFLVFRRIKTMELSDVRKVASLARLAINESEMEASRQQMGAILDYVRLLDEVDLEGVAPMPHPVPMQNVFRDDQQRESLPRDAALSNACKTDGQFFLVPRILEEKG